MLFGQLATGGADGGCLFKPDEDILGALLERADEEGGVKGVEYKMRSVPLKPGEKVNEEPPKVRFDQEDDFDNRFGEGLKFGEY